jgi:hypothetical protein
MSTTNNIDEHSRSRYRDARNELKCKIKTAKRNFYQRAFSSKKPKDTWEIIHRILNPIPEVPKPLRVDHDELNTHFSSTSERVTGTTPEPTENLWSFIDTLPGDPVSALRLREVSYREVLCEIKTLRSGCSCGPDGGAASITPDTYHKQLHIKAAISITLEDGAYLCYSKS